jgi:hypothetical protein
VKKTFKPEFINRLSDMVVFNDMDKHMEELKFRAINGYNRERSGGVQIVLKPGHYDYYSSKGTTHGAWNPYDIHIPCLFMGWSIQHGESAQPHYMTDIAATVCAMLHIQAPNGCIGTPIF